MGSIFTAYIVFLSRQYTFGGGSIRLAALTIGESKTSLLFIQAVALGIMCNALVCMAVWLCYSARSTTDGNIIGGAVMVGLVYWFVYLRKSATTKTTAAQKAKA